jgi:hypothetical protein
MIDFFLNINLYKHLMKEDHHVDMSGRLYETKNVGVAWIGATTKNIRDAH